MTRTPPPSWRPPGTPRPGPAPAQPKWLGERFRHAKWSIQDRAQGGPPKAPNARSGQPGAGRRRLTTAQRRLAQYNTVSRHNMVIFWHTGLHRKTWVFDKFSPLRVAWGGPDPHPLWRPPWDAPARPSPSPAQTARGAIQTRQLEHLRSGSRRATEGPKCKIRATGPGRRRLTTAQRRLGSYNTVSGPNIVIFLHTGLHQKT